MEITMTLREALEIQAKQLDHYAAICPDRAQELRDHFRAVTKVSEGDDLDAILPLFEINKKVPRGASIEHFLGLR